MVHKVFDRVRNHPNPQFYAEDFRKWFSVFFLPKDQEVEYENVSSWLQAIALAFPKDKVKELVHENFEQDHIWEFFNRYDCTREEESHVFYFCLLLDWIHLHLRKQNYPGNDNIFGFMKDQNINEVKVVIVGHKPVGNSEKSSGSAFHETICAATEYLIDFAVTETNLVLGTEARFDLQFSNAEFDSAKKLCDLSGWIEQNVLLLNASFTYCKDEDDPVYQGWNIITDFFIQYLSSNPTSKAFIFAGEPAAKKLYYVDKEKHTVSELYHPSYYTTGIATLPRLDWRLQFPFFNANLHLYKTHGRDSSVVIDWLKFSKESVSKERRQTKMLKLMDAVIEKGMEMNTDAVFFKLQLKSCLCVPENPPIIIEDTTSPL